MDPRRSHRYEHGRVRRVRGLRRRDRPVLSRLRAFVIPNPDPVGYRPPQPRQVMHNHVMIILTECCLTAHVLKIVCRLGQIFSISSTAHLGLYAHSHTAYVLAAKGRNDRKSGTIAGAATTSYRCTGVGSVLLGAEYCGSCLLPSPDGGVFLQLDELDDSNKLCVIAAHTLHTTWLHDIVPTESMRLHDIHTLLATVASTPASTCFHARHESARVRKLPQDVDQICIALTTLNCLRFDTNASIVAHFSSHNHSRRLSAMHDLRDAFMTC